MKRIARWSVLALLSVACSPQPASTGHGEDVAAITEATDRWAAAFERGDVEAALAFVTPDARFVPPNEPLVSGADAIEAWARGLFGQVNFERVASTVDTVLVAEDWAVSRGQWAVTLSAVDTTVTDTSRYVVIWERQADGSWKVAHDIWNIGRPLTPGDGPE